MIRLPNEIHDRFTKEGIKSGEDFIQGCRHFNFDPAPAAVSQREHGYYDGARSEYFRAQILVTALRDLRHGLFKDENSVNELIDSTLLEYNKHS